MINISHLNYKYAGMDEPVFADFSLQLTENRIYGLLGKNGTGKSTLLYLLAGLLRPRGGRVCVDGTDTCLRRPETLRKLFIVPEEYDLPSMTLEQYVRINKPFYPLFSDEVLRSCLEDFELPPAIQLQSLSMGQKKKVFISFALAAGTQLLLMDEPTNGLDIPSKAQFRRVVAHHMTDERMLIISTHQVHDVESLLEHVLILSRQGLLLDSPVGTLCERYAFTHRAPGESDADVIYGEPSVQGEAVMMDRTADMAETPLNLELLFNAVNEGKVK